MPDYAWVGLDTAGRERRGAVRAETSEAARAQLNARRLYVVRIEEAAESVPAPPLLSRDLFQRKRLSARQLALFTRQLATLIQVAPLEEALRTLSRQSERDDVRAILGHVHAGVVEGRRLSEAMAREPKSFPPLYRAMVSAGEGSGMLPAILERLAAWLERQAAVRGKVLSTLAYPVILAIVAAFVVLALMIFVVPRVVEQFQDIGQRLPLLTRIVIGISHFLAHWWWALLIAAAVLVLLAGRALKEEGPRLKFDAALLKLPLIGRLIRDLHAARMARTLSTMVAARLPLLEGLRLTTGTVHNRVLRNASAEIAETVRTGGSLSGALRKTGVFPPLLVYLAASGEASGRLDLMLERAADYLEREFDSFTSSALSLLEPAIIIVMGGVVAVIVLSILLPILQLDTLAGGL
ncbi:type II secretion system inner membrane protein GspF [Sphingosinicella ginsenosidimutans]|uniref:Type II secretion system protein GspF n=1 Tax=Allosphingosinicella ginsenosidimutans TaxID=1176539 RepID=A0A5C6TTX1_9SPHN|nr:type II secretion system inner membrane protein GspF [Sphingosinicella ginsenosidimutans]TXC63884.1 type II secretion system protein GspF [Sphingosinicella ginsenosidimutans]